MFRAVTPEFTAGPLPEAIDVYPVAEAQMLVAEHTSEVPYIWTRGIYTCKGITIHRPEDGKGLLAHLAVTTHPNVSLSHMVESYGGDISDANITVFEACTSIGENEKRWPSIETIAAFFMKLKPRSLAVERNRGQLFARDMALHLLSGEVLAGNREKKRTVVCHESPRKPELINIWP